MLPYIKSSSKKAGSCDRKDKKQIGMDITVERLYESEDYSLSNSPSVSDSEHMQ